MTECVFWQSLLFTQKKRICSHEIVMISWLQKYLKFLDLLQECKNCDIFENVNVINYQSFIRRKSVSEY